MKKFIISLFAVLFLIPLGVGAKENELVKVYVFETGGCGACQAQMEYLKSLDSYGKKFTVIEKKLYDTTSTWNPDEDYELGVKVVEAFNANGFSNANTNGTPLVIISDLYAATTYSDALEAVINAAYDKGDADVVGCFAEGKDNCLSPDAVPMEITSETKDEQKSNDNNNQAGLVILIGAIIIVIIVIVTSQKSNNEVENIIEEIEEEDKEKIEIVKIERPTKTAAKKKPTKIEPAKKGRPRKTTTTTSTAKKNTTSKTTKKTK